jgi:hypothetical protein
MVSEVADRAKLLLQPRSGHHQVQSVGRQFAMMWQLQHWELLRSEYILCEAMVRRVVGGNTVLATRV